MGTAQLAGFTQIRHKYYIRWQLVVSCIPQRPSKKECSHRHVAPPGISTRDNINYLFTKQDQVVIKACLTY